ncbi:EAL domain-containing protein [Cytobacillus pseudoceanisediminis]|uniref:EAL domain-containing protein n=1 Tax=Cytobacillus pseudoceanisediminis TaxID=3051614 RepID=A0ABZ2ZFK8_9BACI
MKGMVHHYIKRFKPVGNWGKLMLPLNKIKYFPPQFIIRDPIAEGVNLALKQGFEVAVAVFNFKNWQDLSEQLGELSFRQFIKNIKIIFLAVIQRELEDNQIIIVHDHYSDGLALILKVDHSRDCVTEIDQTLKKIVKEAEKYIHNDTPHIKPVIDTGYMFVEKKYYSSVQEAVYKAHQHALAMAEKRVRSEFNEMMYKINKIVAKKDIKMLAQPIINVATGEIKAWEMLTRGPSGTSLESPLQLFSIARQTGSLYDLELIVLEKTLEQITKTGCNQDIFINFTPITIGNERFVRDVKKMLTGYKNIPPEQITLEITERDPIEGIENFIYNIKVLRTLGFRVAVDDTGAGYASLNSISEIMPDIIKIDRSVIKGIDTNRVKESMLKGLLLVAKEAGSLVVAEGIESEGEASVLSRNNVDLAQGYFYARPDTLTKSLKSS